MHVPFNLKVQIDHAKRLEAKLQEMIDAHEKEVAQFQKKIKSTPHNERMFAENARLNERRKRLTLNHLLRIVLSHGIEAMDDMKIDNLLGLVEEDTVVRGRPRER